MSKIASIEAWPVSVPLEIPYEMAPGVVAGINRTVVRVTTADGVVGLGESTSPADSASLSGELGQSLVGRSYTEVLSELGRRPRPRAKHRRDAKVLIDNPLSGVEIALWDVAGREDGKPLFELLGGACRREVAFSEYFAYRGLSETRPIDIAAYCARMIEEHGSPIFEGKVAVRPLEEDIRMVREIRAAIGAERALRLDGNMGWRLDTARDALRALEPFGIANIEEPVASFEEMAELRESTAIPFSAHTPDVELASELGTPDTLVIGFGFCGGIAGTRKFIADCEAGGVGFWFYSGDLGIATAAYLHVVAATPYIELPSQSLLRWTADDVIAGGPFSPENGVVSVSDQPGLGIELDEVALSRCVDRFAQTGAYDYYGGPPLPRY